MWMILAFGSALFAGMTAILSKNGIKNTDSNVATAIRTIVILIFSWLMVFIVGSQGTILDISRKTMIFLILSGLATGASWLCYFRALQLGDVNKVTPIDKSSTILTMLLAFLFLGETLTLLKAAAVILIGVGTYLMIQKKASETIKLRIQNNSAEPVEFMLQKDTVEPIELKIQKNAIESNELKIQKNTADPIKLLNRKWILYASFSALFASLTSILGKVGIEGVESSLGTAIRTIVVLVMAWMIVLITKKQHTIKKIDKRSWIFLILSGIATGCSWLCYYRALKDGPASVVVPIDKLSILITIIFSYVFLKEKLSKKALIGLILIVSGTLSLLI